METHSIQDLDIFVFNVLSPAQAAVVSAFAQTLRRYTSLNHLAQAARAVLQNTSQINQMLSDLNRVDFANVQVCLSLITPRLWMSKPLWLPVPGRGYVQLTLRVCLFVTGAGVLGVPVWRKRRPAFGAGL